MKIVEKVKYTTHAPSTDTTFIMIDTYISGLLFHTECVGWYHGEPNEEDNKYFSGRLKATYKGGL